MTTLTIESRYNGPPDSGNGGYVAGRLAEAALQAAGHPAVGPDVPWVEVTLRQPPPLGEPMLLASQGDGETIASQSETVIASARLLTEAPAAASPVPAVPADVARQAEESYLGLTTHPFPTCWVCGPSRPEHDGYDLRPGLVDDDRTACTWTVGPNAAEPTAEVAAAALWAALDCPGAWTALQGDAVIVLGRIAAQISAVPQVGDTCVIMGRLVGIDGRKSFTATTVYAPDGTVLARALATWIQIG
ncbi:MAG: hypothetical protein WCA29_09725 [Jiangellales bacterium]